jgi:hypothetical protein
VVSALNEYSVKIIPVRISDMVFILSWFLFVIKLEFRSPFEGKINPYNKKAPGNRQYWYSFINTFGIRGFREPIPEYIIKARNISDLEVYGQELLKQVSIIKAAQT